jgi:hypothetical protein
VKFHLSLPIQTSSARILVFCPCCVSVTSHSFHVRQSDLSYVALTRGPVIYIRSAGPLVCERLQLRVSRVGPEQAMTAASDLRAALRTPTAFHRAAAFADHWKFFFSSISLSEIFSEEASYRTYVRSGIDRSARRCLNRVERVHTQ